MAGSNSKTYALIIFAFVANALPLISSASEDEVLSLLAKDVARSLADLGNRIEQCENAAATRSSPLLDKQTLSDLGASSEEFLVAAAHFNHVNAFRCEKDERMMLVYKLGELAAAKRNAGDLSDEGSQRYEDLLFPPLATYEYSLRYGALSSDLQDYFREAFGEEPFDLSSVLEALDLVD